jgi:hypothetical protein
MTFITYAQINQLEEFGFIAGTDYTLTFNVFEADGQTPLDLGGATVKWVLSPYGQTSYNILELDGTIVSASTFEVEIPSASTEELSGKYIQQPVVISFIGETYRAGQGVVLISPRIPLN